METEILSRLLGALVDCRAHEVRPVLLLFLHSFLLGLAWNVLETIADTLFLAHYGAQGMPLVYLLTTAFSVLAAFLYTRLEARLRLSLLFLGLLALFLFVLLSCRLALFVADAGPVALAVRVAHGVMYMLGDLEFWALAGQMLDLRQGKRLYPLIGSGEVLSEVVGGVAAALLATRMAIADMLYLPIAAMALCLLVLVVIVRGGGRGLKAEEPAEADHEAGERLSLRAVFTSRYLLLLLAVYGIYVFAWYFVDFAFLNQVGQRYADDEPALAHFLATFYAIVGAVHLVGRAVLAPWLINRFGVTRSLLALPLTIAGASVALTVLGVSRARTSVLFWVMAGTKLCDWVLAKSLQESLVRLLYQPLPARQRPAFQALAEGMFGPIVAGLASGTLLLCTALTQFTTVQAAEALLGVVVVWVVASLALGRGYARALQRSLSRRKLGARALELGDVSTRQVIELWLRSPDPIDVTYALRVLDQDQQTARGPMLVPLLAHPSAEVRAEALGLIERYRVTAARAAVERLFEAEAAPALRGRALRALLALGEDQAVARALPLLRDPRPELREGALVGLLRYGGLEGMLAAGADLLELLGSARGEDRLLGARVLGAVGVPSLYRPLLRLLGDPEERVRRGASRAAAQVANPGLCPALLVNLAVPSLRGLTLEALAAVGPAALPAVEAALDRAGDSRDQRILLVRACRSIPGEAVVPLLKKHLAEPDRSVRREVLAGLLSRRYVAAGADGERVLGLIQQECARAGRLLCAQEDLAGDGDGLLERALSIQIKHHVADAFVLLAFLYPSEEMRAARTHFDDASPDSRSLALEVIDQLLPRELKLLLFPLVEDLPRGTRLQRLPPQLPREILGRVGRLDRLLDEEWLSEWARACVLYQIGRDDLRELGEAVARCLAHRSDLVRETAAWARRRLAAGE